MACSFDANLLAAYIDWHPLPGRGLVVRPGLSDDDQLQVCLHLVLCMECREIVACALARRAVALGAVHDCSEWQQHGQCSVCGSHGSRPS